VAILGDCMAYMRTLADKSVDWVIADPPYGIGAGTMNYVSKGKTRVKQPNGSRLRLKTPKMYHQSDFDREAPPQAYFDEVCRVSRNQIIFGIDYYQWSGVGPGRIVWDKCVADGVGFSRYERAYCSPIQHEETVQLLHSGFMQAESLANPTKAQGNKQLNEKRIHPTQKPRLLYQWLFQRFVQPGQTILDTHLGSGSSRIVAEKMGIPFVGIEIDPTFYLHHQMRFEKECAMPLFQWST
jgi:site-specific DNA-methyltransferase (adenine-specific)